VGLWLDKGREDQEQAQGRGRRDMAGESIVVWARQNLHVKPRHRCALGLCCAEAHRVFGYHLQCGGFWR